MPSADPAHLTAAGLQFLRDRHLATFTSRYPDGRPHVTPVGFTWDADHQTARVITSAASRKARNVAAAGTVVLCQVDGRRWMSLEGAGRVTDDPTEVALAVEFYTHRYRVPRENPARVAIEITVSRCYGSADFFLM